MCITHSRESQKQRELSRKQIASSRKLCTVPHLRWLSLSLFCSLPDHLVSTTLDFYTHSTFWICDELQMWIVESDGGVEGDDVQCARGEIEVDNKSYLLEIFERNCIAFTSSVSWKLLEDALTHTCTIYADEWKKLSLFDAKNSCEMFE